MLQICQVQDTQKLIAANQKYRPPAIRRLRLMQIVRQAMYAVLPVVCASGWRLSAFGSIELDMSGASSLDMEEPDE